MEDGIYKLKIIFSNQVVECPQEGGDVTLTGGKKERLTVIVDLNGYITCPEPIKFCRLFGNLNCPDGCSGRGVCMKGECFCDPGFEGDSCNYYLDQEQESDCIWPYFDEKCTIREEFCLFNCWSRVS